jgi:preprotein translocase subunit YajC
MVPQVLAAHVVLAAALKAKATTSSSSSYTLLILIAAFALIYFLVIRPRSRRQRALQTASKQAGIGDKIVTVGGLVGTIVAEDGDQITLSTGNGVEVVYLRQAIGRTLAATATSTPTDDEAKEFEGPPPGFENPPSGGGHTEPDVPAGDDHASTGTT